jgi:hypothetical protein
MMIILPLHLCPIRSPNDCTNDLISLFFYVDGEVILGIPSALRS